MPLSYVAAAILSIVILLSDAHSAFAQNYPYKPVRLVTSALGGSPDFAARLVALGISGRLGQNVIVDNRGSLMSGDVVAHAAPDGYTLLLSGGSLWVGALLQKTPYDPVRDYAPIAVIDTQPSVLVVSPTIPVKSVKELIALAKSRPGELNYASSTTGSATHLAAELFMSMGGVKIQRVSYKGVALAISDLMSGRVQLAFPAASGAVPYIKSGRVRALAVTSAHPSELLPGLPTIAASGLPGYESVVLSALFAPAKTPVAIINRLNQEVVLFLRTSDAKEKLLNNGTEPVGSSPQELAQTVKSEMLRWGKIIKDVGIRAE